MSATMGYVKSFGTKSTNETHMVDSQFGSVDPPSTDDRPFDENSLSNEGTWVNNEGLIVSNQRALGGGGGVIIRDEETGFEVKEIPPGERFEELNIVKKRKRRRRISGMMAVCCILAIIATLVGVYLIIDGQTDTGRGSTVGRAVTNDPNMTSSSPTAAVSTTAQPTMMPVTQAPTGLETQPVANAPTVNPANGTNSPTFPPTNEGSTTSTTIAPTAAPTSTTSSTPTTQADPVPTSSPTQVPTIVPTSSPTQVPTIVPTSTPTTIPTLAPTPVPTADPTRAPSLSPTAEPTGGPTSAPTSAPTTAPTTSPTTVPTSAPTVVPTAIPTAQPTPSPTTAPVIGETSTPTNAPIETTDAPTTSPSSPPFTSAPTAAPVTPAPTAGPTSAPTSAPTVTTDAPTSEPTETPCLPIISAEKVCFTLGETIPIDIFQCSPTDRDWIGIYPDNGSSALLQPVVGDDYVQWKWLCELLPGVQCLQPQFSRRLVFDALEDEGTYRALLLRNGDGPTFNADAYSGIFTVAAQCP